MGGIKTNNILPLIDIGREVMDIDIAINISDVLLKNIPKELEILNQGSKNIMIVDGALLTQIGVHAFKIIECAIKGNSDSIKVCMKIAGKEIYKFYRAKPKALKHRLKKLEGRKKLFERGANND